MSLVKTWAPYFQPSARMRGRGYYLSGRVTRCEPQTGELVRAIVRGRREYTVTIRGDGVSAAVGCTCPRFAEGHYCKHIWATLLDVHNHAQPLAAQLAGAADGDFTRPRLPKARKRDPHRHNGADGPIAARTWLDRLNLLRPPLLSLQSAAPALTLGERLLEYVVRPDLSEQCGGLIVELRQSQADAPAGAPRPVRLTLESLAGLRPVDREICALLLGGVGLVEHTLQERVPRERSHSAFQICPGAQRPLLRQMIQTGRCFLPESQSRPTPLHWDQDAAWQLVVRGEWAGEHLRVMLVLARQDQALNVREPQLVVGGADGLVIHGGVAAALDDWDSARWISQFRDDLYNDEAGAMLVPRSDVAGFLDRLYLLPALPQVQMPSDVARPEQRVAPVPHVELMAPAPTPAPAESNGESQTPDPSAVEFRGQVSARVWFEYGPHHVRPGQPGPFVAPPPSSEPAPDPLGLEPGQIAPSHDAHPLAVIRRDHRAEDEALALLLPLGFRAAGEVLTLSARDVPTAVAHLTRCGWVVSADNRLVRTSSLPHLAVSSGLDWFELRGRLEFQTGNGVQTVTLPDILAAARHGRGMVRLDDGTIGVLPEQWLRQIGILTALGKHEGDHLRFSVGQTALLDALLERAAADSLQVDAVFQQARERVRQFECLKPMDPGPHFRGTLRAYQRDGLGWLSFLRWFGMGGILADDMGLGKTVQVLAALELLYAAPSTAPETAAVEGNSDHRPTLVVAPRSVVFNWLDEADRFTPGLRVQAYSGAERHSLRGTFAGQDVIVTSYGLLRRDIDRLREHEFEYVVLDEAQAIKNPASQGAKAARLLRARHRLALTGTPVENHLGDLWSIFEFLNPGILGSSTRFAELARSANGRDPAAQADLVDQARAALRPFILRRTKAQVLSELPEKTEQTLLCQMEDDQRKVYDDLLKYYRGLLLASGSARAASAWQLGGSAMVVIEALLRLRQAACHPALIDPARQDASSAKIDVLLEQLTELIDEGHKALVFSQFTSMLALVRQRLDAAGLVYEYLDGQTRDRRRAVERFQTDAQCPLFLISLKAGGLGLNLTAADYVFILDPWWNPAVEQQAIDRAHRIGQTRHVFAYRLICEDTVEQRIAELQASKKELAEAILGGQDNVLRTLTRDDLERLLS